MDNFTSLCPRLRTCCRIVWHTIQASCMFCCSPGCIHRPHQQQQCDSITHLRDVCGYPEETCCYIAGTGGLYTFRFPTKIGYSNIRMPFNAFRPETSGEPALEDNTSNLLRIALRFEVAGRCVSISNQMHRVWMTSCPWLVRKACS